MVEENKSLEKYPTSHWSYRYKDGLPFPDWVWKRCWCQFNYLYFNICGKWQNGHKLLLFLSHAPLLFNFATPPINGVYWLLHFLKLGLTTWLVSGNVTLADMMQEVVYMGLQCSILLLLSEILRWLGEQIQAGLLEDERSQGADKGLLSWHYSRCPPLTPPANHQTGELVYSRPPSLRRTCSLQRPAKLAPTGES